MGLMDHTIGIKKDGTCVGTGYNYFGQCNVLGWTDIVQISCGYGFTIGLKKDGTCVAVGLNNFNQCNVSDWKDVALLMDNLNHISIKYILNVRNKYYSIKDKHYNTERKIYESIGNILDINTLFFFVFIFI